MRCLTAGNVQLSRQRLVRSIIVLVELGLGLAVHEETCTQSCAAQRHKTCIAEVSIFCCETHLSSCQLMINQQEFMCTGIDNHSTDVAHNIGLSSYVSNMTSVVRKYFDNPIIDISTDPQTAASHCDTFEGWSLSRQFAMRQHGQLGP